MNNNYLDDEEPIVQVELLESTPVTAEIAKPIRNDTLVIPDVLFKINRSDLNPQFSQRLDSLVQSIQNKTFTSIKVIGHTDSMGAKSLNQALSLDRAITVKNYLVNELKIIPASIITKGMADDLPVASNRTIAGRRKNRRVEIVLIK